MQNKKGFTLVEAVVAAAILGITVVSLLGVFVMGRIGSAKAKHRIKTVNLLQAKMEWVKGQGYSIIESWVGNPLIENNVDDTIGEDELLSDIQTTSVVKDADNNLIVTVSISWDEKQWFGIGRQQEEAVALVSP